MKRIVLETLHSPLRRVARNFGIVTVGQAITTITGLAALTLNSRALGAEDLGKLLLIQAMCELVTKVLAFQNWQSYVKVGSELEGRGSLLSLWRYGITLDIAAAILATLLAVFILTTLPKLVGLDEETANFGLVYAFCILFSATSTSLGALRLFDSYLLAIYIAAGQSAALLTNSAILFIMEAPVSAYLVTIPVITALFSSLLAVVAFFIVLRQETFNANRRFDRVARGRFLKFALGVSASGTLNAARQRGEILAVGAVLDPSAAALYGVAYRLAALVSRFSESARLAVYPEFSRMLAAGNSERALKMAHLLSRWTLLIALAVTSFIAAFGADILEVIFGKQYRDAARMLTVLSAANAIFASIFAYVSLVQITHGSWEFFKLNLLSFACFTIFAVLGPQWFGFNGVGLGALSFSAILCGLCLYRLRPRTVGVI